MQAFERRPDVDARLLITGTGVAADEARAEIRTGRVEMLGMVDDARLEKELQRADVAFVSQRYDGSECNVPSKLMNFMAYRLRFSPPSIRAAGSRASSRIGGRLDRRCEQPGRLPRVRWRGCSTTAASSPRGRPSARAYAEAAALPPRPALRLGLSRRSPPSCTRLRAGMRHVPRARGQHPQ